MELSRPSGVLRSEGVLRVLLVLRVGAADQRADPLTPDSTDHVPLAHQGEYDGWFCPCHGSQYDSSGRIRKGPAPANLPVPPYAFLSDSKIQIG